jgi:2-succinyl-5-enolpyruvyl-6-hydroxy-3-cyclohexene-1-carboxylate synthase
MPEQTHYDIAELLAQKGLNRIVMSPGSRCAPLTIAMVRHPQIKTFTISDERSAAFIALGMAESSNEPVALLCTSGSAAVNYYPAITEAFYKGIPLFIMTADRPPELIDLWDGQTIRQTDLYKNHILKSITLPPDADANRDHIFRMLNESFNLCIQKSGPVHVNIPLREPLYPKKDEEVQFSKNIRIIDAEETRYQLVSSGIKKEMNVFQRMMIVVGQTPYSKSLNTVLEQISRDGDAVIVADHIANLNEKDLYITHQDIFLGTKSSEILPQPDLLITVGKSILSKKLKEYLRNCKNITHWQVGEDEPHDTFFKLKKHIQVRADRFLKSTESFFESDEEFVDAWASIDKKAETHVDSVVVSNELSEIHAVSEILKTMPKRADIHLSNSLPTRYVNAMQHLIPGSARVYCNRGTSGIDGCSSTAVGHALSSDRLQLLITGDLAFFYDRNAFWHNYDLHNLRIVILNNHGGGIFRVIKGPSEQPELDEYFDTKQKLNAKNTASDYGMAYKHVSDHENLSRHLKTFFRKSEFAKIIEIETEKEVNSKYFKKLMTGFGA